MKSQYNEKLRLSLVGEFLVAAKLLMKGYDAYLTLKNYPKIDIFVHDPQTNKTMGIQVKTIKQSHKNNPSEDGYNIISCTYYDIENLKFTAPFIFVHVLYNESVEYFIVPPEEIPRLLKEDYDEWLNPAKHKHKKPIEELKSKKAPILIRVKFLKPFENKWEQIEEWFKEGKYLK
jgi:hypothetical protein